ncbi:hypothetical protein [Acinetobacter nosocomialis]|nr:hypothetical protein [Acinetobacter nosocomialis]
MIAADKRAMNYNVETNELSVSHNNENKIQLWCRGALLHKAVLKGFFSNIIFK